MNYKKAQEIITKHKLISGEVSRRLLNIICKDQNFNIKDLPKDISINHLELLRTSYKEKLLNLKNMCSETELPRYLVFYHLLQDKFPSFTWSIDRDLDHKVKIRSPRIENLRPSLLSLLTNNIDLSMDTYLHRQYPCIKTLSTDLVGDLSALLKDIHALYPDDSNMQGIVSWLHKGLRGAPLTIFSAVCPDYSVEKTGDNQCPYRHTFNDLGSNIGLVAQRILDALPNFDKLFRKYNINVTPVVAMGDFEVYAESNLTRLNLSAGEFSSRIQKSHDKTKESSKVPIHAVMFTEFCNGYEGWISHFKKYQTMFSCNNYGDSGLSKKGLLEIIKARKPLYDRWLGKREQLEEYIPQLLGQGAEYAAMGEIINQNYDNCLILGADHSAMAPFYSADRFVPSLYLKRFYC